MISCRAFHLPREFTSVVITAVYVPPQPLADNNTALDQLFGIIDKTETSRPDAAFVVAGDFNTANMKKVARRAGETYWTMFIPLFNMGIRLSLALPSANQTTSHCCCCLLTSRNLKGTDR